MILNKQIIKTFNGCGNDLWVMSIIFDQSGYMAAACPNGLYLFNKNSNYTGKNMSTPFLPKSIGFDSKGRFIVVLSYQISIYQ